MSGTVNISRGIWDDDAFKPEPFTEREAFIWMIMEASYKPRKKPAGKIWVTLERGQLAVSVRFMCDAWGWSKSRVDRFLKRLENRDMIGTESGTGINVITICKYDEYQNEPGYSGTVNSEKRDSSGTAAGQQRDKPNKGLIPDAIREKEDTDVSLCEHPPAIDEIAQSVSAYNATAERVGWPKIAKLSTARRAALRGRLRDSGGATGWEVALSKAEASRFLRGEVGNFRCTFDWLTKAANFTKLMEGNYDDRTDNNSSPAGARGTRASGPHHSLMAGFAEVANRHR